MIDHQFKKVVVGMSGGVDSSVSAYILKQQCYKVVGLFMKNWEEDDNNEYCSSAIDFADAKLVCNKLNIELYSVNFSAEYWDNVFTFFLSEHQAGRTPNPDILCNKKIKFKVFLDFACQELSADYIATGHYVQCKLINGYYQLLRSFDNNKDQSYFLHTLDQNQLAKSLFPIGKFKKSFVRQIAKKIGLINAKKKDSTGICFIGKKKYCNFITRYLPAKSGMIITVDGKILGKHNGLICYTLGQRKGLGIGGVKGTQNNPWYVVDKDFKNNQLIVSQGYNNPYIMSIGVIIKEVHWINPLFILNKNNFYTCKTRYQQSDIPCIINLLNKNTIIVKFNYSVRAVTPGQSVVFYDDKICLGGGIIESRI